MAIHAPLRLSVIAIASSLLLTPLITTVGEGHAIAQPKKARKKPAGRKRGTRRTAAKKAPPPAPAPAEKAVESNLVPSADLRGPTRLDFDDRLIQGQTNKSGAVYLFDRKETGISSMVRRRRSFRQLTIRTVYDR